MSFWNKLFGTGASKLVTGVMSSVEKLSAGHLGKKELHLEIERMVASRDSDLESTIRAELGAKERVLVAELTQGDNYTKRARPSVVYVGLAFIGFNYVVVPMIAGLGQLEMPAMDLPQEFWMAWGGIVATWSIGRSAERVGASGKLTKAITGSKKLPSILD
jgi:hypothetical protein